MAVSLPSVLGGTHAAATIEKSTSLSVPAKPVKASWSHRLFANRSQPATGANRRPELAASRN